MMIEPEHTPVEAERNTTPFRASLLATTTIPALGMTFREAADQARALLETFAAIPEEDEAARDAHGKAWERLHDAILSTPAQTFGDLFAKVERMGCGYIGMRVFDLEAAAEEELARDVQRLLPQIIAAASADAEIFAAFERWKQSVRELVRRPADIDDDTFAGLCTEVDAVALKVIEPTPTTMEGLAAQIYTMLHLEHSGTMEDPTDIALVPPFDPDDSHTLAIHTIVNRVKLLGKARVAGPAPSEELQKAWGELVALDVQVEALPGEALDDGRYDAIVERSRDAARRVLTAPAHTVGDLEILAKLALRSLIFHFGIDEAEVRAWFTDGDLAGDDERDSLAALWRVAKGLRNLTKATPGALVPAANDQHQNADAFADTVAAFEAEAPATLALPLEPTVRMVDAGASAAGITPAQFQAAYAAAVEALKLERAA
ncbi:hypothetical protein [Azospirillum sp. B2RO_4]|uniref:hypothetical protein n=1 Tax=Azospirillum sp. B2RO_4 TaxID=3027796 RepID=UPI003DA8580B